MFDKLFRLCMVPPRVYYERSLVGMLRAEGAQFRLSSTRVICGRVLRVEVIAQVTSSAPEALS